LDIEALEALIQGGETPTVEFKVAPPRPSDLAARICGFANSLGGLIIIGVVDKTWQVVGVQNVSDAVDTVLQAARLCKPTVQLEPAQPLIVEVRSKQVVLAYIPPNNGTLYQAGGVYWIRRGTYTVPMEAIEIEEFLYNQGILAWELRPVLRATLADLDMTSVQSYLEQRPERMRQAGRLANLEEILLNMGCAIRTQDESKQVVIHPTNAGMLLFGYNPQEFLWHAEVICTLYKDNLGLRRYADRRILHGTITQQIDQAEAFFRQYIPVAGRIEGFHRIDEPDYPLEAIREAIVNAVVHRDYSLQGEAIRIFYYPDRIEIHNPGLLMPGISLEELQQGKARSKPRNLVITTVLRDSPGAYMERVGSGITFMINAMRELGRPDPQFKEQGEFIVIFRRVPSATDEVLLPPRVATASDPSTVAESPEKLSSPAISTTRTPLTREERQELILSYIHKHGSITNQEYRALTGVSNSTALRDLEILVEQGTLRAVGQKRTRRYTL
jgi:ATP-dependent DNA helicase RecG